MELGKNDYGARLRSDRPDELGSLADDIDKLAAQLQTSKDDIGRKMIELTEARENADRANATKSMFLARVSHELRDPLTAVVGNLEILANTQTSEYQQRAIRLAEKNTEFLLRQIDDILEFSLLEAGRYRIDPQYIDPADVVEVVSHSARPKAEANRLSFSIELETDEQIGGCLIKTDPVRLQQILTNLIDNAIKFTHQGGVHALLSLKAMDSATAQLVIEVTDTGVGIPREDLDHIFEMFEQVQPPVSREHGGVGIGLSITKSIVEALDGDIAVESEPLKGSRFTVTLTTNYSPEPDDDTDAATAGEPREREKVERILLIEDNPDNQRVISTLLGNIDIQVDIANHGIEGLQLLKSNHYDIVFIDCFMPQMDGFEFTRKVREWEHQTRANEKTMLIGLTAGAQRENIERCYATGMDDVITKPFYRIDIYKRVLGFRKAKRILAQISDE
jgi:signal transduction histidine kinase/ActR/RegA family two-component response regulator